jgi:proteasome lid subunit RPN8/RPN11
MDSEKYLADAGAVTKFKTLKISAQALDIMRKHGIEEYPCECCGFLFGVEENVRFIFEAKPVSNSVTENQRRRFEIMPKDYMNAERYAAENDLALLGVYHSHPDHPAVPSIHDFRHAVPFFSYIIVSVRNGRVDNLRSWQINSEGHFQEETIATDETKN